MMSPPDLAGGNGSAIAAGSHPLTLRLVPQGDVVQVTWDADVIGRRASDFRPPYDAAMLPLVTKALDAAQWPSHPQKGPQFDPLERDRLVARGYWADGRVATDIHRRVGRQLYDALVADPEGAKALGTARDHATAQSLQLAYLLRFPPKATELAALPWELLWDERGPLLLSQGQLASCVRYLDLDQALPPPSRPGTTLRLLAIAPQARIPERVHQEDRAARTAAWAELIESGQVAMEELSPATPARLVDRIQAGPPVDILHFYGHGRYQDGQGALLFDAAGGGETWLGADRLAALLGETRLVVLHACQSSMVGSAGLLTGVAPALSAAGVPAVVAMQLTVRVAAATRFAGVVYRSLARGESVQHAVSQARQALYVEEIDGASWYVPTLSIRARETGPLRLVQPGDTGLSAVGGEPPATPERSHSLRLGNTSARTPETESLDDQIRSLLRPLMGDRDSRRARLTRAFARYPGLLDRIDLDGETGVFLSLLLQTLRNYGDIEPGEPAIRVLLESVRGEVGAGDRAKIDQILGRYSRMAGTAPADPRRLVPEVSAQVEAKRKPMSHAVQSSPSPPPPVGIDFLILTPLPEERDAVLRCLQSSRKLPPSEHDIRVYYASDLSATFSDGSATTYRVVLAPLLGMGRVEAANATGDAIRRWRPRYILLVGIAGGLAKAGVGLGDVLVSDQIVDYELQKLTEEETKIRWQVHRVDPRLLGAAQNVLGDGWQNLIAQKRPGRGKPRQHIGPICTGDKVIANGLIGDYREVWSKLIGVEMEAGGTASAAFQAADSPGFFMIRGVSDLADGRKDTSVVAKWRAYACDVAASYAVALLQSGPVPAVPKQETSESPR
jgi:nucleoside phosphorylase/CHAT domain-containing protein